MPEYEVRLIVKGETNLQRVTQLAIDGIQMVEVKLNRGKKNIAQATKDNFSAQCEEVIISSLKKTPASYKDLYPVLIRRFNRNIIQRAFRSLMSQKLIDATEPKLRLTSKNI